MNIVYKNIARQFLIGSLLSLSTSITLGAGSDSSTSFNKYYAGGFGGFGRINSSDVTQLGTVYFIEAQGGPLAVSANGSMDNDIAAVIGAHIGAAWPNSMNVYGPVTSAVELEGFYMRGVDLEGSLRNKNIREAEQTFVDSYKLKTGVFLLNAVFNPTERGFQNFTPYLGFGLGSAVTSISKASSKNPIEPGVQHFSERDVTDFTFAAQTKLGLRYNIQPKLRLFAEYRLLYLAQADYTFGPALNIPGHAETSPWTVKTDPQYYNMGTLGFDYSL